MFNDAGQILQILIGGSTFLLVMSLWIGVVFVWASRQMKRTSLMRQRLGLERGRTHERVLHLWRDGQEFSTRVEDTGGANGIRVRLEKSFMRAGWPMASNQILTLLGGMFGLTGLFAWVLSGSILLGLGAGAAIIIVVRIVVLARIAKRASVFDQQLVECLELASRSLRAGHPLLGAFHLLAEEMPEPICNLFAEICQQHELGADLESVLRNKGQESASTDLKLFATSVAIQMRSGGNLADLMDRLALVIRERIRGQRRIKALTAQTQLSKRILLALPFIMFVVLNFINPKYMQPFYEVRAAQMMLGLALGLLAVGAWVMNRMVQLKH